MRFGALLYGVDPEAIARKAVRAEELGYESLWRGDHVVLPETISSAYPHSADGRPPIDPDAPILDVLAVLAYVAQATSTIRLATGILILPLRHPVELARSVQTLDVLSGGRITLGVGVGWLREEFELLGRNFDRRGALADEAIATLRALWTDRLVPPTVQRPHPPIVGGGESPGALRRAAALCDGWYGHWPTPDEVVTTIATLRRLREHYGRLDRPFEITVRVDPGIELDAVRRFQEAGVDRLVAITGAFEDGEGRRDLELLERFADRVVHRLAPA